LPTNGFLIVRLDSDGDVSSVAPTDLTATAPGSMDAVNRIVLRP
jgi:hypothetical protein